MTTQPEFEGLPSRIYLLGFMGSGKSTLGPILANVIGYRFIDLDAAIEKRQNRTIASLFNELGESGFRNLESDELRKASRQDRTVVSCGGGVVTVGENRALMKDTGLCVYLKLSADQLAGRLGRSSERPILFGDDGTTLSGDALRERIENLVAARSPFYESADLVIEISDTPVGITVDRVAAAIRSAAKRSI